MINVHSKYDNIQKNGVDYVIKCTNTSKYYMLSAHTGGKKGVACMRLLK